MEIRDYQTGDEQHILPLFAKTFGKPLSEQFWKWRFLDNSVQKVMIKLMWDDNLLVGHYAASPVKLQYEDKSILSALSMTTMTHPDYAGQGIFSQLADALYQSELERSDLKAVWGFPNNNSHYAFQKNLRWQNLETIPTFTLPTGKIKTVSHSHVTIADTFTEAHAKAVEATMQPYAVRVERSSEYLTWRYKDHPENTYVTFQLNDGDKTYFAVTKVFLSFDVSGKFEVDLAELVVPNDETIIAAFLAAINHFYADRSPIKFNMWLPLNDPKHITLEKLGFVNATPITYFGIKLIDPAYDRLLDNKSWDYALGYSDVY